MLKNFLEEFWWLLVFVAIAVIVTIAVIIIGLNSGSELDIVTWTINPANPSSPVHQIMP
jgi:hypothetical protein